MKARRGAGAVERGGLENRCALTGAPWVRIPPPPLPMLVLGVHTGVTSVPTRPCYQICKRIRANRRSHQVGHARKLHIQSACREIRLPRPPFAVEACNDRRRTTYRCGNCNELLIVAVEIVKWRRHLVVHWRRSGRRSDVDLGESRFAVARSKQPQRELRCQPGGSGGPKRANVLIEDLISRVDGEWVSRFDAEEHVRTSSAAVLGRPGMHPLCNCKNVRVDHERDLSTHG